MHGQHLQNHARAQENNPRRDHDDRGSMREPSREETRNANDKEALADDVPDRIPP